MNISRISNQYWQLTRILLLPTNFIRKLLLLLLSLAVLSGVLIDSKALLAVTAASSFLLFIMLGLLLPGQMLALVSSKQLRHLTDLRQKIFVIACVFLFFISFTGSGLIALLEPDKLSLESLFPLVLFIGSFVAIILMMLMVYLPKAAQALPLVFFLLLPLFGNQQVLNNFPSEYLWVGIIALWVGFYIWWINWHPEKFFTNAMTLTNRELRQEIYFDQGTHNHLQASFIVGLATQDIKGFLQWQLKEIIQPLLIIGVIIALLFFTNNDFINTSPLVFTMFVFFVLTARSAGLFYTMHKNLYRLWMNSLLPRAAIFSYVERFYCLYFLAAMSLISLLIALVNFYIFKYPISLFHFGYLLVIATLFAAYTLYFGLGVYAKYMLSLAALGWLLLINYSVLIAAMAFFNILWGSNVSSRHSDYWLFSAVLIGLILLMRLWAKFAWRKVNFQKVKI